ncbi:TPA: DUF262 domain-containing protein [Streptococcus suis]
MSLKKKTTDQFFTIKTRDENVANIINKLKTTFNSNNSITIGNLNVLKNKISIGDYAFIVLGGDRKPWTNGLVAIASFNNLNDISNKIYEANMTIRYVLPNTLTPKDYLPFQDTTEAINIGPSIKGSPNQAITSIERKATLSVLAGIISYFPESTSKIKDIVDEEELKEIQYISDTHKTLNRIDFEGDEDLLDVLESDIANEKREYIAASRAEQKELIRIEKQELQISALYDRYLRFKNKADPEKKIENLSNFEDTLVLSPDFQRNSVWTTKQKKELIESVLLGIPLPAFYFSEDNNGNLLVVDGKQRLTSIFQFLSNEFSLSKDFSYLNDPSSTFDVKYDNLQEKIQRKIGSFFLTCYIINSTTSPIIRNEIFTRVNRGGVPLNAQEVRSAVNIGLATTLLENISDNPVFLFIPKTRKKDQYLALRFVAFYLLTNPYFISIYDFDKQYKHIDILLDTVMKFINSQSEEFINNIQLLFDRTLKSALYLFNNNQITIFSKPNSKVVNMNIFETWMTVLSFFDENVIEKNGSIFIREYQAMINSEEFDLNISFRRDSKEKIKERLQIINNLVENIQRKLII